MKLCFLGGSHAAQTLREAARRKGFTIAERKEDADLVFISEDTPTDENGKRDLEGIGDMIRYVSAYVRVQVVVTSQVPPGFMRSFNYTNLYHQAETLRMEDAMQRALYPEMLIVGFHGETVLPSAYQEYLEAFDAPILKMTYEDAEFTKIAINAFLISQVETSRMLADAAQKCNANWRRVSNALRHDARIGKYAYLHPGEWAKSKHLLRDYVTLVEAAPDDVLLRAWR